MYLTDSHFSSDRAVASSRLLVGEEGTFVTIFEKNRLGTYIDCSGYVSPTMVGNFFLKPRLLKVGFILVNFLWISIKFVEKAHFDGNIELLKYSSKCPNMDQ